ncbi:MAG: hypothetical protein SGJ00_07415 [bacterium]|nr:hypothetical protein [bacterium]
MKKLVMIIIFAVAASLTTASAQQPKVVMNDKAGWHKIGETTVDFTRESDVITVMGADRFASLQFKVTEAPIHLVSIVVFYESGDSQKIKANKNIKAPGQSNFITLNGGERNLKKIEFVYKTLPNRKDVKSQVEIWGLKTNANKK